jgi:hypothetical protein
VRVQVDESRQHPLARAVDDPRALALGCLAASASTQRGDAPALDHQIDLRIDAGGRVDGTHALHDQKLDGRRHGRPS